MLSQKEVGELVYDSELKGKSNIMHISVQFSSYALTLFNRATTQFHENHVFSRLHYCRKIQFIEVTLTVIYALDKTRIFLGCLGFPEFNLLYVLYVLSVEKYE